MAITDENAFLFEEHRMGVRAIANKKELALLEGLTRDTPREEFAKRYAKFLKSQ